MLVVRPDEMVLFFCQTVGGLEKILLSGFEVSCSSRKVYRLICWFNKNMKILVRSTFNTWGVVTR